MVTDGGAGAPVRLTRAQARRIAVRAQLLDARRPDDLLATVEHLMVLPVDPTAAVAPAVDPRARRCWGYFALPVLHGDRFVGKVDATADRRAGVLRVDAIHEDLPFDPDVSRAVRDEFADLAGWLGLDDLSL